MLKRMDLALLAAKNAAPAAADEPEVEVAADDEVGVKGIFAGLKSRANGVFGKKSPGA